MDIVIVNKPLSGRRERHCMECGDIYFGYNMYVCLECETRGGYTIVEAWCD